jgi:DNA-binding transcriptional regulator YhcF (GntR family)
MIYGGTRAESAAIAVEHRTIDELARRLASDRTSTPGAEMAEAPYRRIADDIARMIRDGELKPGAVVPSTRRLVRDHGIAMATASKVIAALKADGLVETVPGSGTRVRAPAGTPRSGGEPSRDEVLDRAIRLADADGIELLTMRRLAQSLGIPTMSLYRYAATKGELLLLMADRIFVGVRVPQIPAAEWRARLEAAARIFRELFAHHPWAAGLFSLTRPQAMPNVLALAEWNLQTLRSMGLDAETMMYAHINLFGLVTSMSRVASAERQAGADTGTSIDDWADGQASTLAGAMAPSAFPAFGYVIREGFDYDLDAVFEYGLQRMIDGIGADAARR